MKHKCITILGVLSVIFLLCSCTNGGNDKTTSDKPVEASENNQEKNSDKGKKLSAFEKLFEDAPLWVQDENGLYGFINASGEYVIEPKFDGIADKYNPFSSGICFVGVHENAKRLWGIIDKSGKYIVEPTFSEVGEFSCDLAYVSDANSGLYGYIDKTGKYQIEPQYTEAREFVDEIAIVSRGYGYEYINTSGENIFSGVFDEAKNFSNGIAAVKSDGLWGYIDQSGEFVIQPTFEEVYPFSEGVAFVRGRDGDHAFGYYLIDKNGNYLIDDPIYAPIDSSILWRDNLCLVQKIETDEKTNYCALINKKGEKVLPQGDEYFGLVGSLYYDNEINKTYVWVRDPKSDLVGCIDTTGEWLVKPQYDSFQGISLRGDNGNHFFHVSKDNTSMYIDRAGNILAKVQEPLTYREDFGSSKNIFKVISYDGIDLKAGEKPKYGYVSSEGNVVIDIVYDKCTGFSSDDSYARAQYKGLWGIIDANGDWIIPAKFVSMQGA